MRLFTTEQVSKYHPDKYADQISDAILTECLKQDKHSHCGIETMVKDTTVILAGEITTNAVIDYNAIVKRIANKLGYKVKKIINLIGKQSREINSAVESDENIGAGDQGIMFGYASAMTESFLPFAFDLANKIIKTIENNVHRGILQGDAKCQVTVDLDKPQTMESVEKVLVSVCHSKKYTLDQIKAYIRALLNFIPKDKLIINPSGEWTIGGPIADCGLTGRKIVCDQYGGFCPVGGGAFSGKDPSKVDRSASYMARKIAVDLVKKFKFNEVTVQLAYMIGVARPMSINVEVDGHDDLRMTKYVTYNYDLTPKGIIEHLDLYNQDYEKIAEGCHYRKEGTRI